MSTPVDRRKFHRARASILVRPAGPLARVAPRLVKDISLGGLRALSDDRQKLGARLEIELIFPAGEPATCLTEVVWIEELARGAPALARGRAPGAHCARSAGRQRLA